MERPAFFWAAVAAVALAGAATACDDDDVSGDGGNGGSGDASAGGGGNGGSGNTGNDGGGGDGGAQLNGCDRAGATDMRSAETSIVITAADPWTFPHQQCIVVDVGDDVVWEDVIGTHPLAGGVNPTEDPESPITAGATTGDVTINFPEAGEFPYFCKVHHSGMQGVVYVE